MISVITPTFPGREKVLLERCIPSVQAQIVNAEIEHLIISDRNPELAEHNFPAHVRFVQINETWRNPVTEQSIGAVPWMIGSRLALGEFFAFLGDDDEFLPQHLERHVTAMLETESLFSVSKVEFWLHGEFDGETIGDDTFEHAHLDGTGIMCHKDAISIATWDANGENAADWRLVRAWRDAGLRGTFVDEVTAIHHDGWKADMTGRPDRLTI